MSEYLQHQAVTQRKKRRQRVRHVMAQMGRIGRVVLSWSFGVALLLGVYLAIGESNFFAVDRLVIRGDLRALDEATVREVSGIHVGDSLFRISLTDAQGRLRRHPWVREVAVRRKLPNTVWIYVTEREPMALLNIDGLYLVDKQGDIFKAAATNELADLPIFTGVNDVVVDGHGVGHSQQLARLIEVYKIFEQHPLADQVGCSEIVRDRFDQVSLVTEQPAMQLRLGHHPSVEQFDRFLTIVPNLRTSGKHVSTVDLFTERKVVVRYGT